MAKNRAKLTSISLCLLVSLAPMAGSQEKEPSIKQVDESALKSQSRTLPGQLSSSATRVDLSNAQVTKSTPTLETTFKATIIDPQTKSTFQIDQKAINKLKGAQSVAVSAGDFKFKQLPASKGRIFEAVPMVILNRGADDQPQGLRLDRFTHGFAWGKSAKAFSADLFFTVHNIENTALSGELANPVTVRIGGSELLGEEQQVKIRHLGFNGEKMVTLMSDGHDQPIDVTVRSDVKEGDKATFAIDVASKPRFTISTDPDSIAGFGIESTEVTINSNELLPAEFQLDLDSTSGKFDPQTVTFNSAGRAKTRLWSARTGSTDITVADPRFSVTSEIVEFRAPIGFIVACLIGATMGSLAYYAMQRYREAKKVSLWGGFAAFLVSIVVTPALFAGFEIPRMIELPAERTGLIVVATAAGLVAILFDSIFDVKARKKTQSPEPQS